MNFQKRLPPHPSRFYRWLTLFFLTFTAAHLQAAPDFGMKGWATVGEGTTGGAGGEVITVSRPEDLIKAIDRSEPLVIQVQGMMDLSTNFPGHKSNGRYYVRANKTIVGLGADAGIRGGGLRLSNVSNVIIRNLTFRDAPDDSIVVTHGSHHVWIDHNDLANGEDGLVDITRGSDFITVSWNRFSNHDKTTLVGDNDGNTDDRGFLRVTYHDNWFRGTNQRHPRVRYGKVHLFNNFMDDINAGIGIGVEAEIFSENNYFQNATTSIHYQDTDNQPGYFKDSGSDFGVDPPPTMQADGVSWHPKDHYDYRPRDTNEVKSVVTSHSGVGIIDGAGAPQEPPPGPGGILSFSDWLKAAYPNLDVKELLDDPTADPIGSGMPNLLRYAMGVHPADGASEVPRQQVGTKRSGGKTYLTLTYNRLKTATDVQLVVEVSTNLASWKPLPSSATINVISRDDVETVTVRDTVPMEEDGNRFMRVRVVWTG